MAAATVGKFHPEVGHRVNRRERVQSASKCNWKFFSGPADSYPAHAISEVPKIEGRGVQT